MTDHTDRVLSSIDAALEADVTAMNSGPSGDPCPECDDPMFKVRAPSGDVYQECMSCEYSEEPR